MNSVELGQVSELVMGQAPPGSACNSEGIGMPFVKAGQFGDSYPIINEWTTKPLKLARSGDVLVCVVGATSGKLNLGADCAIGRSVAALRPRPRHLAQKYLYYFLTTWIERLRSGSQGSAQGVITRRMLHELKIPLPPLAEQKRIVAILDKANAIRRKRLKAIRLTEEFLRSAFLDMFGDPVTNPKGWPELTLDEIAEIISGVTKGRKLAGKKTVLVPYMRVANVQDGRILLDDVQDIQVLETEVEKYRLKEGDILLTEGGDPDKLGRGAVWKGNIDPCIHQNHIFRVRVDDAKVLPEYLSALIGSSRGKRYFLKAAKQTTGIATINKTQLRGFPALIPPIGLQYEYLKAVSSFTELFAKQEKNVVLQNHLSSSLVQRAFRGELVPQEPIDPPASELLERIRAEREAKEAKKPEKKSRKPRARVLGRQQISLTDKGRDAPPTPYEDSKKKPRHRIRVTTDRTTRIRIETLETDEVMAAFRKTCRGRGAMTREGLLKEVAQSFGYQRLGSSVGERLKGHLRATIRRGIVEKDGDWVRPATRTIDDYNPDFLIETMHSVMRSGESYDREEVIRAAAEHLGFSNVTDKIRRAFQSAIRRGIRIGEIVSDRATIWRL